MHRQRTKFSRRVNRVFTHRADRVAKAIERQGIRATYELHDRLLSNRASRGSFGEAPPQLDDVQRSILADVREQGYSLRSFHDVVPDASAWARLLEQRDRFVASTEADLAAGGEHVRVRPGKEFVVRLQSYGVELGPDDPWFGAVSSHRLLDIANAYLEMWSKLEYVDVWYSVPQRATGERISSQRWHRDYNDKHLLKVFLYLVDVDEDMGRSSTSPGASPAAPTRTPGAGSRSGSTTRRRRSWRRRPVDAVRAFTGPPARFSSAIPRGSTAAASRRQAARARDGDVLIARLARGADRAELHVLGRSRRARAATRFALS